MAKRKTWEEFLYKAREIHGNKYDYSKAEYINTTTPIIIICPEHGEFKQQPSLHLKTCGCLKCSYENGNRKKPNGIDCFIAGAQKVHGDKYDYSKSEYVTNRTKLCIICHEKDEFGNEHGEFWQIPYSHLKGHGCPKCAGVKRLTKEEFITLSNRIHSNKYDYSKVEYQTNKTKVCIICPEHGEFWQKPNDHLVGHGCSKCSFEENGLLRRKTKEQFIKDAIKIHGDKYDYSSVDYINSYAPVAIICPKHGEFLQKPVNHLGKCGCPKCNESNLEITVRVFLEENKIEYVSYHSPDWLGRQSLDFYLPEYKIAIECQGIQHFEPTDFTGKMLYDIDAKFDEIKKRDLRKRQLCEENGVKLLYYSNLGIEYPYHVYEDLDELLKEIKSKSYENK